MDTASPETAGTEPISGGEGIRPAKSRGGRPLGAKNKLSKDARALLAKDGWKAISTLIRISRGLPVYRVLRSGKGRERLDPTLPDIVRAATFIGERLLPALRSSELTGKDGEPLLPAGPIDNRELAKSILAGLATAVPAGRRVTVEDDETHVARFRDPDLGRRIMPEATPPDTAIPDEPSKVGDTIIVDASIGVSVYFAEIRTDGRERWLIVQNKQAIERHHESRQDAINRVRELIENGKLKASRPAALPFGTLATPTSKETDHARLRSRDSGPGEATAGESESRPRRAGPHQATRSGG